MVSYHKIGFVEVYYNREVYILTEALTVAVILDVTEDEHSCVCCLS